MDLFQSQIARKVAGPAPIEHVVIERPLNRVLRFTRRSIDDIVNFPIAKREVLGYYKLHRWVVRESEVSELEKQWNALRQ